jgi:hypothetical protein
VSPSGLGVCGCAHARALQAVAAKAKNERQLTSEAPTAGQGAAADSASVSPPAHKAPPTPARDASTRRAFLAGGLNVSWSAHIHDSEFRSDTDSRAPGQRGGVVCTAAAR